MRRALSSSGRPGTDGGGAATARHVRPPSLVVRTASLHSVAVEGQDVPSAQPLSPPASMPEFPAELAMDGEPAMAAVDGLEQRALAAGAQGGIEHKAGLIVDEVERGAIPDCPVGADCRPVYAAIVGHVEAQRPAGAPGCRARALDGPHIAHGD